MSYHDPVLVSGSSAEGGGLFVLQDGSIELIDRLTTMGLSYAGGRVARVLKSPDATETMTEVIIYDARGVERYQRVDGLGDPHDIALTDGGLTIVSSIQNRITWIDNAGNTVRVWEAPVESDGWHINCLLEHEDAWYISVFGKFATHRGWAEDTNGTSGFLMRLDDGAEIITGLSQPHTPRFIDGVWVICNSAKHELIAVDERTGQVVRRAAFSGYTRGIAVCDDVLLVGESAGRYSANLTTAAVSVLDRKTWDVIDRVEVDTKEIYDLVPVPEAAVAGVRTAFRTSRFRTYEQDQMYLFQQAGVEPARMWATGDRLPAAGFRVAVEAEVPAVLHADQRAEVPVSIENRGNAILVTAPPHPVFICYRWIRSKDGRLVDEGQWLHTPLPRALPPKSTLKARAQIAVPCEPGDYVLRITLLQQDVAWFDEISPRSASVHRVRVEAGSEQPAANSGNVKARTA